MSAPRRRGLQIDDPLGPGPSRPSTEATNEAPITPPPHAAAAERRRDDGSASAGRPPSPRADTVPATERRSAIRHEPTGETGPAGQDGSAWREWTGLSSVGSFRLPHELLAELGDTARELGYRSA